MMIFLTIFRPFFQEGLLMERDSHGNFQFSQVETEKVLMGLVKDYLDILKEEGRYRIGDCPNLFSENTGPGRSGPGLLRPPVI